MLLLNYVMNSQTVKRFVDRVIKKLPPTVAGQRNIKMPAPKKIGIYHKCQIPECDNQVYIKPCDEGKKKFCSRKCQGKSQAGKTKPPTGETVSCLFCGDPVYVIPSRKSKTKYCSKECADKAKIGVVKEKTGLNKNCLVCGTPFYTILSQNGKYCSTKCSALAATGVVKEKIGVDKKCAQCPNTFYVEPNQTRHKFCSKSCADAAKVGAPSKPKTGRVIPCLNCAKEVWVVPCEEGRKRFCSKKCAYAYNSTGSSTLNKQIRNLAPYKKWRKAVLLRDKHQCVKCHSTEKLEVDHIIPWCAAEELRYEISNGQTLCHDCHVETDTYGGGATKYKKLYKEAKANEKVS